MRQQARFGPAKVPSGRWAVVVAAVALGLPLPALAEVQITHGGVDCVVAGEFPVIAATLLPPDEVARARVYFHARGTSGWYFVEMKSAGGTAFEGILPQPLDTLDGMDYYIETLGSGFDQARSQEFSADVIRSSEICPSGRTKATMLSSVSSAIVVGAPEGASAIPSGFANVGIAGAAGGAAGGVSTGVLLGIGGAGAGAVAIGVAVGGGDGDSSGSGSPTTPSAGGTPEPMPTPTPEPMRDVTGRWAGNFDGGTSATECTVDSDLSLDLQQSGNAVTGTFQMTIRAATSAPQDPCPVAPGDVLNGPVSGVVNGDIVTLELGIPGGGPTLILPGMISDDRMGGADPDGDGSWEVRPQ